MAFEDVRAIDYDRFMGRFSGPLAETFAEWAGIPARGRVLDVGSGALTAVLADRLGAASVSAIEPKPAFVDALRARVPGADVRIGIAE